MFVLIGYGVVIFSIFGGFVLAGGHLYALLQPIELLMIFGGAAGAFVVGNDSKTLRATVKTLPTVLQGTQYTKSMYMDLLAMMFEILTKIRKDGMMAIEKDVENPENSVIFGKYPKLIKQHHLIDFICDYLRLMLSGNMDAFQIENLMDNDIETYDAESHVVSHAITRMADGMPAFGIVAAVMGVVHTMESVGSVPPAELGALVAKALVGTFLGILLGYGFVGPLASLLDQKHAEVNKMLQTTKVIMIASLNGYAPTIAVEFGRKVLFSTERPGFLELEDYIKEARTK
ncbi:flagellar motor stator protein MotA [Polynucleobacter paneuropaeus]|uniref:flagellar motor stator protein MotA n=1 Tax=Polynucleobacter paludilacus TaxID=1855895 RepID=UPI001BFD0552|nr:flagellar motor stator protein MotA [Polynucleobacter paludilacus]QWD04684.1 flagellar motor stator protein MotA [Polynucleobacter paneuropaeus]QWD06469.1 flagellar motor stator protein MotA [Polynucleobacter paneuropaeus]QWD48446.1 flagellar motor stator protein MotA [Polynucleobacter paneuropaeus]QWD87754.1 flagellar motor stator protein MotA [Polynucleobacter paludilacus]